MSEARSVLITGANRGLGHELWRVFAKEGWRTFPLVRSAQDAQSLVQIEPLLCHPIVADVATDEVARGIESMLAKHALCLDVVINNAGIPGSASRLSDVTTEEVLKLLQVHCLGALRVCKAAMPWLQRAKRPVVVNVSSRLGSLSKNAGGEFSGRGFSYAYRIAKAAQNMLSVCLAEEFSSAGISVLAIHPGLFKSATAASDATLSPEFAARRFYRWLLEQPPSVCCRYFEPSVGELPW